MPDRENVIKEWEKVLSRDPLDAPWDLIDDTLALLKEQEKQKFFVDESGKITPLPVVVRCKDCIQSGIDSTSYPKYWCSAHSEYHDGDWFCADGERK